MVNNWEILGIEKTDEIDKVKKAYAKKSKIYHPETHPLEFKQLHTAYKAIIQYIKNKSAADEQSGGVRNAYMVGVKQDIRMVNTTPSNENSIDGDAALNRDEAVKKAKAVLADEEFLWRIENESKQKSAERYDDMPLKEFEELLDNEYYQENWRKYFTSPKFLKHQYNPDYVNAITEIIEKKLRKPVKVMKQGGGRMPQFALIYLINAYGCFFDNVETLEITESIYNREMLEELKKALLLFDGIFYVYLMVEQRMEILSERYAFYVYRNILEILEQDKPDRNRLREWLIDGFMKENRSHLLDITYFEPYSGVTVWGKVKRHHNKILRSPIFFELMIFLLSRKENMPSVFKDVLKEVCYMKRADDDNCDEIVILKMMLEEE